jgi:hypothetical protein
MKTMKAKKDDPNMTKAEALAKVDEALDVLIRLLKNKDAKLREAVRDTLGRYVATKGRRSGAVMRALIKSSLP